MEDSILNTIKILVGIEPDDNSFDVEIITHINSTLMILQQLGVGPKNGFMIISDNEKWSDFIDDEINLNAIKTYIGLKVGLVFDTNSKSSATISAIEREIKEYEWRLNSQAEFKS